MKLEVGMYVRDIKGRIDKIIGFKGALIEFEKDLMGGYIDCNDFTKASYNIIDILEVGDYVNGEIVLKDEIGGLYLDAFDADGNYYKCRIQNIKTIVTKEQFEQMAYKVGD